MPLYDFDPAQDPSRADRFVSLQAEAKERIKRMRWNPDNINADPFYNDKLRKYLSRRHD